MEEETIRLQFQALPFGLSSPRIFTKVMAEALATLPIRGISVTIHLDNLLLFAPSPERLTKHLKYTKDFLENLDWLLNLEKSNQIPSEQITYLGYVLD